jgi:succinate dehydrogenase / fumarate reductase cytochrome b subunit
MQNNAKERPRYLPLNIAQLPINAKVSIFHRVSGIGLFLFIPFLLYLFQATLGSPEAFSVLKATAGNPLVKLILFGLLWAFLHHIVAGVRYLLLDVHQGIDREASRKNSLITFVVSLSLFVLIGVSVW